MEFRLNVDPDLESETPTPKELLAYAVESIQRNDELVWDIYNDDGTLLAENVQLSKTPVSLTIKSGGGSMTETSNHPDITSAQEALYQWVYSSWAEQFTPDEEWTKIPVDPKAAIREYFTRNKEACSYDIQQFTRKQDDDFDRDENGHLTEEGKAQLVAWSQERGLLNPPPQGKDK